jgi:alpha-glucosidase
MSPARRLLRVHTADQPDTHQMIAQMRSVLDEYLDRVFIGEAYLPIDRLMLHYGAAPIRHRQQQHSRDCGAPDCGN